jgi:hypothetical protein
MKLICFGFQAESLMAITPLKIMLLLFYDMVCRNVPVHLCLESMLILQGFVVTFHILLWYNLFVAKQKDNCWISPYIAKELYICILSLAVKDNSAGGKNRFER